MERKFYSFWVFFLTILIVNSCGLWDDDGPGSDMGIIKIEFPLSATRAADESGKHPNEYILDVTSSDGSSVYHGLFGESPEDLLVSAGTYYIKVVSDDKTVYGFDKPVYGDECCVMVRAGETINVELTCTLQNSGIRLFINPDFLSAYPGGSLFISSEDGNLMYSYRERRIAYFRPGTVSIILSDGAKDNVLMKRVLAKREILSMRVDVSARAGNGGMSIQLDTTKRWENDDLMIGGGKGGGNSIESALSVIEAKKNIGKKDIWVYGYIVGGDMTSGAKGISFKPPFKSETHVAISARKTTSSKEQCMSVQLSTAKGKAHIREALNLPHNTGNLGRMVYLKGEIVESYYGVPGIKNVSEFCWAEDLQ